MAKRIRTEEYKSKVKIQRVEYYKRTKEERALKAINSLLTTK